jgi:hypothetical protein
MLLFLFSCFFGSVFQHKIDRAITVIRSVSDSVSGASKQLAEWTAGKKERRKEGGKEGSRMAAAADA